MLQVADKEVLDVMFMHVGADVAVVTVTQNGNVVEKHIRPLQAKLVEPAVFGDDVF